MQAYVYGRLLALVPVLVGVSILIFSLVRIIPGDVAFLILAGSGEGNITPQALADVRHRLGLDLSLTEQYFNWAGGVVRFDFGTSLWTGHSVAQEIADRFPITLELAALAILISLAVGVTSGILCAIYQDTWIDYVFRVVSILGLSMPTFWVGTLMIMFLVIWFRWIPPLGYAALWEDPAKNLQQMVWPALATGYSMAAIISRMTRSCMLEVLHEDYVRTARAKGLRERWVVLRHALRNALLPVITISGAQFGSLLGGAVVMETVFNVPGMGSNLVDSIVHRDYITVQNIVLLMAVLFVIVNLSVDMLYGWIDPRIRESS